MFCFKESANEVGKARQVDKIESAVAMLKAVWASQSQRKSIRISASGLSKVTNFLLLSLDMLVKVADETVLTGPDRKATVLDAVERLYDFAMREALPIWLIPVAGPIKAYIIRVLVSNAIDWVVTKYREGGWRVEKEKKASSKKEPRRAK